MCIFVQAFLLSHMLFESRSWHYKFVLILYLREDPSTRYGGSCKQGLRVDLNYSWSRFAKYAILLPSCSTMKIEDKTWLGRTIEDDKIKITIPRGDVHFVGWLLSVYESPIDVKHLNFNSPRERHNSNWPLTIARSWSLTNAEEW